MVSVNGEWKERVSSDSSMSNKTRQPRLGIARIGVIRNGTFWSGLAVEVRSVKSGCSMVFWGEVSQGKVRQSRYFVASCVKVVSVEVRIGWAV